VTVNVNSLGAKHIRKNSGATVLASGDLVAATPVQLIYDGTYWEIPVIGNAPGGTISGLTTGFFPKAASATAIGNSLCDEGITTANTVTCTDTAGLNVVKFISAGTGGVAGAITPNAGTVPALPLNTFSDIGPASAPATAFAFAPPIAIPTTVHFAGWTVVGAVATWTDEGAVPSGTVVGTSDSQVLTNKTLTAPSVSAQVIDCHAACSPTLVQLSNAIVSNITGSTGQANSAIAISGPIVAGGMNFILIVGESLATAGGSASWVYNSNTANIYLDNTASAVQHLTFGNAQVIGASVSCFSFPISGASALKCTTLAGTVTPS
jgi:hypothetical protein